MSERSGITQRIIRWPLLLFIGLTLLFELCLYITIRWLVFTYETTFSSIARIRVLRKQLKAAKDYPTWQRAALEMDTAQGKQIWKDTTSDTNYDYGLIQSVQEQLERYSKDSSQEEDERTRLVKLAATLEVACKSNLGGIENEHLYSHTFTGTKSLVQKYVDSVKTCIQIMSDSDYEPKEKSLLFKRLAKTYGRTVLCLSGGASFGMYHIGVIRCLLDNDCLPNIITGTSAGALIAAICGVRTNDELREVLNPSIWKHMKTRDGSLFFMLKRFFKKGVLFNRDTWIENIQWSTMGSTTFLEAYQRTGRILNISVVSTERHSPPTLLNYLNAPNVVIYSAALASAAIPGLIDAVELLYKDERGNISPFHHIGKLWRDGSLKTDIPTQTLYALFNAKYTIVSQVNPHIIPFFYNNRGSSGNPSPHRSGAGWRGGFVLSSIEHFLKLDMTKWLRMLRDLDLLPAFMGQDWSFVFLQRFNGTVTIVPKLNPRDYFRLITEPNEKAMKQYIELGERITWPKLSMIKNRMSIEQLLQECRQKAIKEAKERYATPRRASVNNSPAKV